MSAARYSRRPGRRQPTAMGDWSAFSRQLSEHLRATDKGFRERSDASRERTAKRIAK